MGCDAKDFDNDGKVDIFYNNLTGQIWALLRNRGDLFEILLVCVEGPEVERAVFGLEQRASSTTTTTAGRISTRPTATSTT